MIKLVVIRRVNSMVVTINERLKDLRSETDLSIEEYSAQIGLSKSTYDGYEQDGKSVPADVVVKIAKLHNVSTDYIVGLSETRNPIYLDIRNLHLSERAIEKLTNPSYNPLVLSEMIETEEFDSLMCDLEIYINGYVEEGLGQYNAQMNFQRMRMMNKLALKDDSSKKELEMIRVTQDDYYVPLFGKDVIPIANKLKEKHKDSSSTSNYKLTDEDLSDLVDSFYDENGNIRKDKSVLAEGIISLIEKLLKRSDFTTNKSQRILSRLRTIIHLFVYNSPTIEPDYIKRRNDSLKLEEQLLMEEKTNECSE